MGETGRKMVYPEFCVKNMVEKTENLYEELINFKLKINKTRLSRVCGKFLDFARGGRFLENG